MWPGETCNYVSEVEGPVLDKEKVVSWCFFSRFIFFHAFFDVKKGSRDIEETLGKLSIPLDDRIRGPLVSSFFG